MATPPSRPDRASNALAGVDEAGRGCLAGPVVAAAVMLPESWDLPGLDDSKKVPPRKRFILEKRIKDCAVAWGLGVVWPKDIDRLNILRASLVAMASAVSTMKKEPTLLLIDGNKTIPASELSRRWNGKFKSPIPDQLAIIGGDALEPSISAASILAKTFRDRLMIALDKIWPGYGFATHKGYGVKRHIEALRDLGPSPMHRLTFARVRPEESRARSLSLFPLRDGASSSGGAYS